MQTLMSIKTGEPIKLASQLFANVNSWTGGKSGDTYHKTIQGLVLLDGEEVEIYRHWSNDSLPIGVYYTEGGILATIEFTNWHPMLEDGEEYQEADITLKPIS